jgi:hypothetical protein
MWHIQHMYVPLICAPLLKVHFVLSGAVESACMLVFHSQIDEGLILWCLAVFLTFNGEENASCIIKRFW